MKLDACSKRANSWIVLPGRVGLIAGLRPSGREFSKSCATSATFTVSDTTEVTAAMTTGAATIVMTMGAGMTATITETTIGGDEFHSLSKTCNGHPLVTLLVYPFQRSRFLPGPLSC